MTDQSITSSPPMTILRGARVEVDAHAVGRVIVSMCLGAFVLAAGLLFWSGAHKNAQITALRHNGTMIEATVTKCLGLLGGSGSNAAGYSCTGTFSFDGRRYSETIPGNTLHAPGTTLRIVAAPGHPPLITTAGQLDDEHASRSVFILPTVLLAAPLLLVGAIALGRQRRRAGSPVGSAGSPRALALGRR